MTPHETIRTMTPTMKRHLRQFMGGKLEGVEDPEGVEDLALRGIIRLDARETWVLSAHGRRVWNLVKLGV